MQVQWRNILIQQYLKTTCTSTLVNPLFCKPPDQWERFLNMGLALKDRSQQCWIFQPDTMQHLFFWPACNTKLPTDHPPLKPWLMSLGVLTVEPNTQECFHTLISVLPASLLCIWGIQRVFVQMQSDVALESDSTTDWQRCCWCCCFRAVGSLAPAVCCP